MAQEGISSGFTTRQKVMAALFVIVLIFLIYEIVGMFGQSSTVVPDTTVVQKSTSTVSTTSTASRTASMPNGTTMPNSTTMPNGTVPLPQPQQVQPLKGLVSANADVLKKQQEEQQQYLSTVNELQMLKLQKDIAETTQAISAAKLATATAEHNISDLFIRQAPAPTSGMDYTKLISPNGVTGAPGAAPNQVQQVQPIIASYVVISVSMQLHRWTAILGYQGKLYTVSIGDVLPLDGSIVMNINRDGVILKKDAIMRKVSLVPAI